MGYLGMIEINRARLRELASWIECRVIQRNNSSNNFHTNLRNLDYLLVTQPKCLPLLALSVLIEMFPDLASVDLVKAMGQSGVVLAALVHLLGDRLRLLIITHPRSLIKIIRIQYGSPVSTRACAP